MPDRPPVVPPSTAGRRPSDARSSRQRSKITNGTALTVGGDERGPWARRVRDLIDLHEADLGAPETLTEAQRQIVRRAAVIETELERIETAMSAGCEVDLDLYSRVSGNLRRLLEAIGIERKMRDVTPPLAEYLAQRQREAAGS